MPVSREVVHLGCLAADEVAIGFTGTGAEKTRAIVERALEALLANGVIKIVPDEELPMFFAPFPPYEGLGLSKTQLNTDNDSTIKEKN